MPAHFFYSWYFAKMKINEIYPMRFMAKNLLDLSRVVKTF